MLKSKKSLNINRQFMFSTLSSFTMIICYFPRLLPFIDSRRWSSALLTWWRIWLWRCDADPQVHSCRDRCHQRAMQAKEQEHRLRETPWLIHQDIFVFIFILFLFEQLYNKIYTYYKKIYILKSYSFLDEFLQTPKFTPNLYNWVGRDQAEAHHIFMLLHLLC